MEGMKKIFILSHLVTIVVSIPFSFVERAFPQPRSTKEQNRNISYTKQGILRTLKFQFLLHTSG